MAVFQDTLLLLNGIFVPAGKSFLGSLPGIIAAILILLLGYLLGALIGAIVKHVLAKTKIVSVLVNKMGLQKEMGKWDLDSFFALIVKWYIFLIFLNPAADVVRLNTLSRFFSDVAKWIPNIILAVIVVMAGYVLSEYLAKHIRATKSKKNSLLAATAKVVTMVFVVLVALKQIGLEVAVAENTFLIILAGVMLALAMGFGLALKDEAKNFLKGIKKNL